MKDGTLRSEAALKAFLLLYESLPKRPFSTPLVPPLEEEEEEEEEEEVVSSVSMGTSVPHTICVKCDFHALEPKTKLRGYTKYAAILDYPAFFPATSPEDDTCPHVGINLVKRLDND